MDLDRRRFDLSVNGRMFKSHYKNRAAREVVRVAVTELGVHPQDILDRTHEGQRQDRASRPILMRFPGRLTGEEVLSRLNARGETFHRRYYWRDEHLMHVGDETWAFTNGWSGAEVEQFIGELTSLFPRLTVTYQETASTPVP